MSKPTENAENNPAQIAHPISTPEVPLLPVEGLKHSDPDDLSAIVPSGNASEAATSLEDFYLLGALQNQPEPTKKPRLKFLFVQPLKDC